MVAAILSTVLAGGAAQHEHLRLPLRRRDGEGALSLAHGSVGRGDVAAIVSTCLQGAQSGRKLIDALIRGLPILQIRVGRSVSDYRCGLCRSDIQFF